MGGSVSNGTNDGSGSNGTNDGSGSEMVKQKSERKM
jgi:hypothetical protein